MGRFFQGFPWRFLFTDIPTPNLGSDASPGSVTTTWADGLLTDRAIAITLNQPTVITAAVWPDNRAVNAIFNDGDPLIAQSNRLIYAFRREAPGDIGSDSFPPWVCRAAGILMSPEDQADTDVPVSHITAYDAWMVLNARACYQNDGTLPGPNGLQFDTTGDQVALTLLKNTITYDTSGPFGDGFCFVDAGEDWGGTSFYSGTLETTDEIAFNVQQGTMVGDAWSQLCDAGNMDIVLTPIYDPNNRPGYTHELNIYNLAGSEKPSAVFGWDRMNRALSSFDRMHDGTPGNFSNRIQYYAGQGGPPVPATGPLDNDASIAKYLVQWATQFFPSQTSTDPTGAAVLAMANQALALQKQGLRTTTVNPTPERSPVPLIAYTIGDRVPIYASKRVRVTSAGYQRVQGIPIQITDDGIEQVQSLLLSPSWRGEDD